MFSSILFVEVESFLHPLKLNWFSLHVRSCVMVRLGVHYDHFSHPR